MSVRPFRDIKRKKTKVINVGDVKIGGDNPISVQSMTNTLTTDVKATINQINDIVEEGADIVRVSCPDKDSTAALKEIVNHVSVPIVADIHFHYKRAVEAAESGAKCLRINPGNIGDKVKIHEVLSAAKNNDCSIRIGVNAGSLERDILEKFKEPCPEALVESAKYNIKLLEDNDFFNFKISVKSSGIFLTVKAYKKLSEQQRNELLSLLQVAPISLDSLTLEEQLESTREDDPVFQSMGSTENIRGDMLIRGIPQYNVGKGADMFQDLPSNITTN